MAYSFIDFSKYSRDKDDNLSLSAGIDASDIANGTSKYDEIRATASDPLMNNKCCAVIYNLHKMSYNNQVIGSYQHRYNCEDTNYGNSETTPLEPNQFDFLATDDKIVSSVNRFSKLIPEDCSYVAGLKYSQSGKNKYRNRLKAIIKKAYQEQGAIPLLCYHMGNPYFDYRQGWNDYRYISPEHPDVCNEIINNTGTTCGFSNSFPDGKYANPKAWLEGVCGEVHDFIAELNTFIGEEIPIIFRPYHECNGSWFWWGGTHSVPSEFKQLFEMTMDLIRGNDLHNVIAGFCTGTSITDIPSFTARMPDKCDIIGFDTYNLTLSNVTQMASIASNVGIRVNKPVAMWEFGGDSPITEAQLTSLYTNLASIILNGQIKLSLISGWSSSYIYNASYPTQFNKFWKRKNVLMGNDIMIDSISQT